MNPEIAALLAELPRHANDPETFVRLRKQILQTFIRSVPSTHREYLQDFQNEIDVIIAIAGSPERAVKRLVEECNDRCNTLIALARELNALHGEAAIAPVDGLEKS